ncbi:MAG TPA: VIT domain-containing protein [Chthonomonadaceae bacterium]|nr:VIT domain-containing protein [Chthonomonadaceae bacterium]
MHSRLLKTFAAMAVGLAALVGTRLPTQAQGILYPRPEGRIQPFYVKDLRVNTVITDAVAETTVEQTFVNSSSVEQEGTYLYPLPEGASPTSFSMTIGDRTLEPRILTKEEARSVYESIVRRRRDPALLEYVDRNLVRISVYPIPPQGQRVIRLRYTEILKPEGGLRKYAYSLSTSRFGARPVGVATVSIKLRTSAPLKNVYSPTHDLSIRRPDDRTATAIWEGANDASDRDLLLYYSTSGDDVGLSLLTYKPTERDGYFMLLAAPRVTVPKDRILPKQVVFVLDRTGSMGGEKIKQARKSLLFCLNNLHPQDRFDVITFNESPDVLTRRLVMATATNIARARRFVEDIEASGGTNIDEALRAALTLLRDDPGHEKMLVFLTDGLPTVGETNINTILSHVKQLNEHKDLAQISSSYVRPTALQDEDERRPASLVPSRPAGARIFCFGLGYDVNVPFLDRLAEIGRGDADYVKPEEDIEAKVSSFFAKVTSPILSNLRLAFDGADVYDIYPKTLPDLFKGSQLVITGRFRGEGGGTVRLAGLANGEQETFKLGTSFSAADWRNAFLPRIWAARKIGYLIDQVRLADNPAGRQEVIDEIIRLSREYGIITEYTSFLVDEREQYALGLRDQSGHFRGDLLHRNRQLYEEVGRRAAQFGAGGLGATNQSLRAKELQQYDKAASRYQSANGSVYSLNGPAGAQGYPGQSVGGAFKAAPGNYAYGRLGTGRGGFGGGRSDNGIDRYGGEAAQDAVTVQAVADKTFYRQANNVWQDNAYDAKKQQLVKIRAFSDAHFALLRAVPQLASYSSVGDEVIVRLGRNAVQIGSTGKEKLTSAELKDLTAK